MVTKSAKNNKQLKRYPIFLVIDGGHGTGKTTLATTLKRKLEAKGYSVSLSKEPFSREIIPLISKFSRVSQIDPYVLQYLILADRSLHNEFIRNNLKTHDFVISVRYISSNLVYQRISGIPIKKIIYLNSDFLQPDILIMLKSDLSRRDKRMRKDSKVRQEHYFLLKSKLLLEQKYYSKLCDMLKRKRSVCIIDAEKSRTEVAIAAHNFIQKHLKKIRE